MSRTAIAPRAVSFAAYAALAVCTALAGCAVRPTQVLVTVDAEPGVRAASQSLGVRIWGRDSDEAFNDEAALGEEGLQFPWVVAMRPQDDDPSRIFRFEATAYAGQNAQGTEIAQTRMISGYVSGEILHVYLLLQDSCIGLPCEQLSEACRDGSCQAIPVNPPPFTPEAGLPDAGAPPGTDTCDSSMAETCNRIDDDCDGRVDEEFLFGSDPEHCGGCGRACLAPNGDAACEDAACAIAACDEGWEDCDGSADNGCETDITRPGTCGDCDRACSSEMVCRLVGGAWTCDNDCGVGEVACTGSCVDLRTSTMHCGGCGRDCAAAPHASVRCEASRCVSTCDPGWQACDGDRENANGCETNVGADVDNCGSCGNACEGAECRTPICMEGACAQMANTGSVCEADGIGCTVDRCSAGVCTFEEDRCSVDGGMSFGDGGFDCASCVGGEVCCSVSMECCASGSVCTATGCQPDADAEAGVDAGTDAGSDSGVDSGTDSGVDSGTDSGTDSGVDSGTDSGACESDEILCPMGFCCDGTCCDTACCPPGTVCASEGVCVTSTDASI